MPSSRARSQVQSDSSASLIPVTPAVLDTVAARQYLGGISPETLYRIRREIGFCRVGRRVMYMKSDLDAYLARNRKAPVKW